MQWEETLSLHDEKLLGDTSEKVLWGVREKRQSFSGVESCKVFRNYTCKVLFSENCCLNLLCISTTGAIVLASGPLWTSRKWGWRDSSRDREEGLKTRGKREIGMWEDLKRFQLGWCWSLWGSWGERCAEGSEHRRASRFDYFILRPKWAILMPYFPSWTQEHLRRCLWLSW